MDKRADKAFPVLIKERTKLLNYNFINTCIFRKTKAKLWAIFKITQGINRPDLNFMNTCNWSKEGKKENLHLVK